MDVLTHQQIVEEIGQTFPWGKGGKSGKGTDGQTCFFGSQSPNRGFNERKKKKEVVHDVRSSDFRLCQLRG